MSSIRRHSSLLVCLLTAGMVGCSAGPEAPDTGSPSADSGVPTDSGQPEEDAGFDAGVDAGDAPDAGIDAGEPPDAGDDAGPQDAGYDAGPPPDAGYDAGPRPDAGVCPMDAGSPSDAGMCRVPLEGASMCNTLQQSGTLIDEIQVPSDPPPATGGWYPAGKFLLTAATLYTGHCGASGPSGKQYAATLQVTADRRQPSIDHYEVIQSQPGCPDVTYKFSGNTFGVGPPPWDHLNHVTWTCPSCPNCSMTMKYSTPPDAGPPDIHGVFTYFLPLENGQTLALEFTE